MMTRRWVSFSIIALLGAGSIAADAAFIGPRRVLLGGSTSGGPTPPTSCTSGTLLLSDGASHLLLAAGSGNICLTGITNPPVSPMAITLPSGVQHFWGLMQSVGYSGSSAQIQRSTDNADIDCGFDTNKLIDQACITAFCGLGCTAFVRTLYDQAPSGAVDQIQTTQALMPIISVNGTVVVNGNGLVAMHGAVSGRYLVAANAVSASQEFSVTALSQNNNPQLVQSANSYSPIVGIGSDTNNKWYISHGSRNVAGRLALSEMVSDTGLPQSETVGWAQPISQFSTSLITSTILDAALSGGPGAGSTMYFDRDAAVTANNAHTPLNIACPCDVRIFAALVGSWTTNSANGADDTVTLVYVGSPMIDSDRQSLEGQIWDKAAAVVAQFIDLPAMTATSEAWNFATYASDTVNGVNGKTNLSFVPAASGSSFSLTTAPSGLVGVYEPVTNNFKNDFQATNTFGADQTTFTMWAIVTIDDPASARIFDFISMATGTFGVDDHVGSVVLSKDHSPFCAWTNDSTSNATAVYTNMMIGDPNAGQPAYWQYAYGSAFMPIIVPAHDNIVAPSAHPPFYTQKKFLGDNQTGDGSQFPNVLDLPIMILIKQQPNPNYRFNEAFDSPNNVMWRNKATVTVKAAYVGSLDGFNNIPGGTSVYTAKASTAIAGAGSRFRHYGGEGLNTFKGWTHAEGFYGGHYTTDAEDQALFYKWQTGVLH